MAEHEDFDGRVRRMLEERDRIPREALEAEFEELMLLSKKILSLLDALSDATVPDPKDSVP